MQNGLLDFGIGAVVGGLTMSAGWGLFWLVIGTVGLARRTCSWRVVVNGLTVLLIPLLLGCLLIWVRGVFPYGPAFGAGLFVVPPHSSAWLGYLPPNRSSPSSSTMFSSNSLRSPGTG
ncbi:MAG TPA: hypothetical protein VF819_00100, partial [Nitrospira sp.]